MPRPRDPARRAPPRRGAPQPRRAPRRPRDQLRAALSPPCGRGERRRESEIRDGGRRDGGRRETETETQRDRETERPRDREAESESGERTGIRGRARTRGSQACASCHDGLCGLGILEHERPSCVCASTDPSKSLRRFVEWIHLPTFIRPYRPVCP